MKDLFGMPIKGNGDDGDSMLWAGLMVAVGDRRPIPGIKMCQSPDGRLWRSPNRVNNQPENSFSRDMSLGFILYFQATQDHEMADKWIAYIRKTKSLFPASESSDTRHIVTPSLWWLMSYAGMKVPAAYRWTRFLFRPYNRLELMFTPAGYQTHLKAVSALILAKHDGKLDTSFGRALVKKDKRNPFFIWLSGDFQLAQLLTTYLEARKTQHQGDGSQWAWERDSSEDAWKDSMGWDFEFMKLLMQLGLT